MSKSKREDLTDRFYTKDKVAHHLLSKLDLDQYENVIEPSAGTGAFSSKIDDCIALDIDPRSDEIEEKDFFDFEFSSDPSKTLIVGNPPFGRQGSKALAFIRKASDLADTIAFILPKSFKKDSMKKKVPKHFYIESEVDLPEDSFIYCNELYSVPVVFQIWKRKDTPRIQNFKEEPLGFTFVKKTHKSDFSVRRVGVYAGEASLNPSQKSVESHYFIMLDRKIKSKRGKIVEHINKTEFTSSTDTSGPNSISKPELIEKMNGIIKENTKLNNQNFW